MIKVNLVGNPNTGKTTLFNSLTGAHEHVGNWHGVTVEEKRKSYLYKGQEISIVDLPGIYSLTNLSYEEGVACDYIFDHPDDLIVNICDESNLTRNLYLTLSLLEFGAKVILAINQIDKVALRAVDYRKLSETLGVPVVVINAGKKVGLDRLNDEILEYKRNSKYNLPYLKKLPLGEINLKIDEKTEFYKLKCLENDEKVLKKLGLKENVVKPNLERVATARYDYIDEIVGGCCSKPLRVYGRSKIDKFLMNRFLALPIFLCILAGVFYLTFFSLGAFISEGLRWLLDKAIATPLISLISGIFGAESAIVSFFEVAIVDGAGSVLGFLPQVGLLFLFLSLLEDSGYMSRVAFAIEDILGKVGLSGKSVYTLLMGFGCSTTAVLTARNMEDKNSKIKTGLLTPYMSCSAKFPIYCALGGAFFGASNIWVILGLYLLGVVVAVTISYILEKTVLKSKQQTFILEFPPYRAMGFKRILYVLWDNIRMFLGRVGGVIISMNVIVWVLNSFSFTLKYVPTSGQPSMLESLGKVLAPIFAPLGFGNWALVSALIAGLVAKEVIVSSIGLFNHVDGGDSVMLGQSLKDPTSAVYFASGASVLSYLVFCLLYFPCLATASVLCKEIGKKWAILGMIIEFIVTYIVAFLIFNIASLIELYGALKVLIIVAAVLIVVISIIYLIKKIKKRKTCAFCKECNGKCKMRKK